MSVLWLFKLDLLSGFPKVGFEIKRTGTKLPLNFLNWGTERVLWGQHRDGLEYYPSPWSIGSRAREVASPWSCNRNCCCQTQGFSRLTSSSCLSRKLNLHFVLVKWVPFPNLPFLIVFQCCSCISPSTLPCLSQFILPHNSPSQILLSQFILSHDALLAHDSQARL